MTDTILVALVDLVKQGGIYALWGLGIWGFFKAFSVAIVLATVYLVVRCTCSCITTNYKVSKDLQDTKITLVSKEVSDRLSQTLEGFSRDYKEALNELRKEKSGSSKS